jgi:hypothetical protein
MTIQQLLNLSQCLASAAVVASVVYLARQVRQAERIQRAMMQQARADRAAHGSMGLAAPELASIFRRGMFGDPAFTLDEFTQWMMICRGIFISAEDSFMQHEAGLLDASAYESYVAGVRHYLAAPGMQKAWALSAEQYGDAFRAFGDSMLAEMPSSVPIDLHSQWCSESVAELISRRKSP